MEDDPRDIAGMLRGMNGNLPVNRRTLIDYVENGDFTYTTRTGEKVSFDPSSIEFLDSFCTEQEKLTLRLPVFVSTDTSSERGGWKVDGRTEVSVLSRLLGRRVHTEDRMPLYYPEIQDLKRRIPGLVFAVFVP